MRLTFLVQAAYAEVSRDCELTSTQAQMLCVLTRGPLGMAELSGTLALEKSSLTGLVDRAEQRGLVVRQPDPVDRRAVRVALTGAGDKAVHRFHDELSERLESLLSELSTIDRDRFTRTMARLVTDAPPVFTDD